MATNRDRRTRRVSRFRDALVGTAVAGSLGLAAALGLHVTGTSSDDTGSTGSDTTTSPGTASTGQTSTGSDSTGLVGPGDSGGSSAATTTGS